MWERILKEESEKDYFRKLKSSLAAVGEFYPAKENIYRCLRLTPFENVRVVILGQDPYHGGQANGLAFAVGDDSPIPPSLRNIFKEIANEYGEQPKSRKLENWAAQGVLLLNTVLTVEKQKPLSHKDFGWQTFTDRIIYELGEEFTPRVFMLWGSQARAKKDLVKYPNLVLEAPHPSPLSAHNGFFGCNHFKLANEFLVANGNKPIDWLNA